MVASMMVNNISTPPSPSYSVIKTEEGFPQNNIDCLVYSPFDMYSSSTVQSQHILRSQRSPQHQRFLSYNEVSLMQRQQHQQRQQQQQQHQMRLQQQRALEQQQRALEQQHQHQQYLNYHSQSQQLFYDTTSTTPSRSGISSAMSMPMSMPLSVPISSSNPNELMTQSPIGTPSSAAFYTPTSAATSMPFFNGSSPTLTKNYPSPTATMMVPLQHQNRQSSSHAHTYSTASTATASPVPTPATVKPMSRRSSTAGSPSWSWVGSGIDKVKDSRSTRVTKPTVSSTKPSAAVSTTAARAAAAASAAAVAAATAVPAPMSASMATSAATVVTPVIVPSTPSPAMTRGTAIRTSRRSTRTSADMMSSFPPRNQPYPMAPHHQHAMPSHHTQVPQTMVYTHLPTSTGNVTHPRRAAQNRAAQRTFRNRRKAYIKDMEQKVLEIDRIQTQWQEVQKENREIWRRFRVLEELILQQGLSMPSFPDLTPFFETEAGIAAAAATAASTDATAGASSPVSAPADADTADSNANANTTANDSLPSPDTVGAPSRNNSQGFEIDGEGEDETLLMMGQQYRHDFQGSGSDYGDEDGESSEQF
ncbi:hypothetical protein BGZ50_002570 [Haplosporangium sp. Z 11]|nr:hypothetical protein BGZ50_002570 [Haplosporangium sp. Z 11]